MAQHFVSSCWAPPQRDVKPARLVSEEIEVAGTRVAPRQIASTTNRVRRRKSSSGELPEPHTVRAPDTLCSLAFARAPHVGRDPVAASMAALFRSDTARADETFCESDEALPERTLAAIIGSPLQRGSRRVHLCCLPVRAMPRATHASEERQRTSSNAGRREWRRRRTNQPLTRNTTDRDRDHRGPVGCCEAHPRRTFVARPFAAPRNTCERRTLLLRGTPSAGRGFHVASPTKRSTRR